MFTRAFIAYLLLVLFPVPWMQAAASETPHKPSLISLIPQQSILAAIRDGQRVVFVDSRETAEHAEERLPGAINLKLREVNDNSAAPLRSADLVITYCIKDFRGFELAKALQRHGVKNVRVMQDSGLKGWKSHGLPVAGEVPKVSDEEAMDRLRQCASAHKCLPKG
jgi:rhodanese-related sulfurtransferase